MFMNVLNEEILEMKIHVKCKSRCISSHDILLLGKERVEGV
jgi:hypothetical protein